MATIQTKRSVKTTAPTTQLTTQGFTGGNANTAGGVTTMATTITPTAEQCERGGCMQYCACKPSDPWVYAVVGLGVGGLMFGSVLYYVGKNRKSTRRR